MVADHASLINLQLASGQPPNRRQLNRSELLKEKEKKRLREILPKLC